MKKIALFLTMCMLFWACGSESKSDSNPEGAAASARSNPEAAAKADPQPSDHGPAAQAEGPPKNPNQFKIEASHEKISKAAAGDAIGYWVGSFGKNKINIALSSIEGDKASGHSVCAGNYRELSGTVKRDPAGNMVFDLKEPGDDKYDGRFEFKIDANASKLTGKWTPYKAEGNSAKQYTLKKTQWEYQADRGDYPEASTRELTESDVENLYTDELRIMRNSIYARHGYCFKTKDMRRHFEAKDWYVPTGVDIRDQLTATEYKNIELIKRYEEYAADYYDEYSR